MNDESEHSEGSVGVVINDKKGSHMEEISELFCVPLKIQE